MASRDLSRIETASNGWRRGFSLVEVAVALGVVAVGLVAVLGLLPGLLRRQADSQTALVAAGLAGAVQGELSRLAAGNVQGLHDRAASFSNEGSNLRLVADAGASQVRELDDSARDDRFFLIELHQLPSGSSLGYRAGDTVLVLQARVSWPFQPGPAAPEVPRSQRQTLVFNLAITP